MTSPLDAAPDLTRRGWSVIPVPHRSKNPGFEEWQRLRLKEADLPNYFNGRAQNIGVLLGEPSGFLVDVDLDHLRCVELADQYLPPTPAVFGRASKPRSHRLYRVSAPVASKKHKSKSAGTLVELRSTGLQTVFPPSTHEKDEAITWETEGAEPAQAQLPATKDYTAGTVRCIAGLSAGLCSPHGGAFSALISAVRFAKSSNPMPRSLMV